MIENRYLLIPILLLFRLRDKQGSSQLLFLIYRKIMKNPFFTIYNLQSISTFNNNMPKSQMYIICLFLSLIVENMCATFLYHIQITQSTQTFTVTFNQVFRNFPVFSYYIQSGNILNNQFMLSHNEATTTLTNSRISIEFSVLKSSTFSASDVLKVALLVTDDQSNQFEIGIKKADVLPSFSLTFPGLVLQKSTGPFGVIEVYSLCFPINYQITLDSDVMNKLNIAVASSSTNYQSGIFFGYIYFNKNYLGNKVMTLFRGINHTIYNYALPYDSFAIVPSDDNVFFAIKQYETSSMPFLNCTNNKNFDYITGSNPLILVGYNFASGVPTRFFSDVFLFNSTFQGCPDYRFLYYQTLYQSLPFFCYACHANCKSCATSADFGPSLTTDQNNCITCGWLRIINKTSQGVGNCVCLTGIKQVGGVCQDCQQGCLRFNVVFLQSTNQTNFLLIYSYGSVIEQKQLKDNLHVYLNNIEVQYYAQKQQSSYYKLSITLQLMSACLKNDCNLLFQYNYPESVLRPDLGMALTNNNMTLTIDPFVNYYSLVPAQLRQGFNTMGIVIAMAFSGGYSSLVTILFQLEQLVDAHRYLNLNIPVIFNQLLLQMMYFRFLNIFNLMPAEYMQSIQDVSAEDLDYLGPPKLLYYQSGLNFYKNSIAGIISVFCLLLLNVIIYFLLKILPFKKTKKFAKKMSIRKVITVHDTLEQLLFPLIYFALQQIQIILLKPSLYWIYALAFFTSCLIIVMPFLIILFIINNKNNKDKLQIYEDLMQDNSMNQKVTYIYYVFNYYRKILFALCLISILPGLIQICLLIILNSLHLAFQIYLVVARTYKSKIKVIIRFINGICVIIIQILILLYNLNDYQDNTMINIGLSCLYLSLVTTLLGVVDVIVKVIDTCQQQMNKKKEKQEDKDIKEQIARQFKNQIPCKIGDELVSAPKDPKQIKFYQDKELMDNTFNNHQPDDQRISVQLVNYGSESGDPIQLVFIDDEDWKDLYPDERVDYKPRLDKKTGRLIKEIPGETQVIQLYQMPQEIDIKAREMNKNRKKRNNKYLSDERIRQIEQEQNQQSSTQRHMKSNNSRKSSMNSQEQNIPSSNQRSIKQSSHKSSSIQQSRQSSNQRPIKQTRDRLVVLSRKPSSIKEQSSQSSDIISIQ